MSRLCVIAAVVTVIVGQLVAQKAFALETEEKGNRPLSELNYTQWKGIVPIVNDKARVFQVWVNGYESFYYKGATKQFNAALVAFAKVDVKYHVVVLRPGPVEQRSSRDAARIPYNWKLHVIGGDAKSRTTDDIEDLEWQEDPVLTVYIGGDIDLDKIDVPAGVTLRAAPGQSEEAKRNEAARMTIEEFVKRKTTDVVAQRQQGMNNLKQIGLAMHNYHATHNAFPPAANVDKKGKQLLSWRVHILPFVDQIALYQKFHLDEPWDSEHNKELIQKIPPVYVSPSHADLAKDGKTVYLVPTGKSTAFEGKEGIAIRDITDGTSKTILAVEAHRDSAVIWTKPDDLAVDFKNPLKGLKGAHTGAFFAALCDGSVRFISDNIDLDTLKALFTRNGGEALPVGR